MTVELSGLYFPEALRWHEGDLWFSDMFDSRVVRWSPGRRAETIVDRESGCPPVPGGLGWLAAECDPIGGGALLVVDCEGRRILALRDGELTVHAELANRFAFSANDMHVDGDGTAWVGSYGFDPAGDDRRPSALVRVDPTGRVSETSQRFVFPNGCERDGAGRLVVAETFADRLSIWDPITGERDVIELSAGSGPDGISIAGDGEIYVALAFARALIAVQPSDRTVRTVYSPPAIEVGPGAGPLACYDCAVEPGGRRIAVALASADEELAERVSTGRVVVFDLPRFEEQGGAVSRLA